MCVTKPSFFTVFSINISMRHVERGLQLTKGQKSTNTIYQVLQREARYDGPCQQFSYSGEGEAGELSQV